MSSLSEFVASAPLTPLLKPDNGIRPIAVGTIWRRLVSKIAMKGVGKEMAKYLNDFQFGVGVSGGAEAVLHSVNMLLNELHADGSIAMLTVDFSNAFNLVDRSALLHEVTLRAIKALKLCCKALWNHVVDLCNIHRNKSQESHDVSEKSIANFVKEAFDKTAFLLEFYQESNFQINGIIRASIVCWSVSENLILKAFNEQLNDGIILKATFKWMQYEQLKAPKLGVIVYSLLSSSKQISKKALGKLLEEIIRSYDEMSYLNPEYFFKMKMKAIDVLLEDIYVTKANECEKCELLIEKFDFLDHINDAFSLCLSPHHGHEDKQNEDMLYFWYEFVDLLSIKGYLEIHPRCMCWNSAHKNGFCAALV
ncbi:hypothetical protein OROMI_026461 [Orobanche minor]